MYRCDVDGMLLVDYVVLEGMSRWNDALIETINANDRCYIILSPTVF